MPILLRTLLLAFLILTGSPVLAQDAAGAETVAPPTLAPSQALSQLRARLDEIKAVVESKKGDLPLGDLRSQAFGVQQEADQLGAALRPQSSSLQARLDVLGPAPEKGSPAESTEISAQRRELTKAQSELEGQIKQANSLSTEATQLAAHIADLRRNLFQTQLAARKTTPLGSQFWADPVRAFPDDRLRIKALGAEVGAAIRLAWQPPNRTPLILCLLVAVALLSAGRWLLEHALRRMAARRMPSGRLRRSAMAVAVTLAYVLAIGLTAQFAYLALNWNGTLDADLAALFRTLVELVTIAALTVGLGRALLSPKRPSWRLMPLSDDAAHLLRPFPMLLGYAALLLGVVETVNSFVGASLATTVASRAILATLIGLVFALALARLGQARRRALASGLKPSPRPVWVGLLVGATFLGVTLTLAGVVLGYIALAYFAASQMLWSGLILATLYILMHLIGDVFDALFERKSTISTRLQNSFGLKPSTLEQFSTLMSGVIRAVLLLIALALVLAPFGAGPQELATRVTGLLTGASVGHLKIVPGKILGATFVFLVGLLILRIIKRWLSEQLLPKTSFDPGMQSSMVTLLGYVGGILVFGLALADLGVDLKSIAWMASALSVGIGFGLQAIVQNFISGLILLAERPVKVGDWVSIAGVEGDIRRINVRATEIQMSDRSTMIVPNSQFITQNVRNVTLANAQGRVSITLPMPLDTDAGKARDVLLDVLREHPATLETPTPVVRLDNLDAGTMTFQCTAYVNSPREASGVKSDLLFEMLERLRQADLPMTSPQSMVLRNLPALPDGESSG